MILATLFLIRVSFINLSRHKLQKKVFAILCRIGIYRAIYLIFIAENQGRGDILKMIEFQNSMLMRGITS